MSSEIPVHTYRSSEEGQGETPEQESKVRTPFVRAADLILVVLTWVALAVVLAIWAVVGAIFWIPLMVRAMLRFSVSLVEATFEGHKPTAAGKILRNAVSFYRRGFVVAVEVVTGEEVEGPRERPTGENRLLLEFLWALLVWYFIALMFGWIQASPLDLLDWFLSIPWADHLRALGDNLTGGR